ncbi:alpha/beta fold hydrolase [Sphingomonas aliaeris]|uniref:Alpha/beta fold hydrolase n=1 Tax=Sphingomonas aliaeris TaxID=2759526 RepID=A0A974S4H6_9SPHN|nr:alpha/beta fold hydrolase [Sphingomonas aliaeris]QQV77608.1 alpha/beta fold hydrolase [Sphingomonas aliaeris]
MKIWVAAALMLAVGTPVSAHAQERYDCRTTATGKDSFCQVGDLRLNFVDWGGRGPAIILLTGLGNSAHIYDEFAPLLAQRHRVIAITRRGYGASGSPADGDYSNATLVRDILGVMDGLGIHRASFIGHSIAGGELATLGADHSDRVDRLIYLDSAYDRSRALELMAALPTMPLPGTADRATLDAFAGWRAAALGTKQVRAVRSDLAAITGSGPNGYLPKASPQTAAAVLRGDIAAKPRWNAIAAPSLAIFTSKDVPDQVPPNATSEQRAAFVAASNKVLRPWMLAAKADFERNARCGTAIEVPRSTHHIFLERPEWTAKTVLKFVSARKVCGRLLIPRR